MAVKLDELPQEYKEIYDNYIMPVDTNIKLESVILSEENQDKIKEFLRELDHRDQLIAHGLEPMNRLLFYGASGCGKTYLSKALSNYLGYTMLYIDIAKSLTDDTVSHNIAEIFKLANYMGNCVLMLDECDAIAWQRDTGNSDTGTIRRATNSIFQYLDQMNHTNIFISATNMLHRLDPAFERRFNMKMMFTRPQLDIKSTMQKFVSDHNELIQKMGNYNDMFEIIDDVDPTVETIISRRAGQYAKLSYYELQGLAERSMKDAVLNDTNEIRLSKIYKDLAVAMRVKINFKTEDDPEEIFHNDSHYDPS